jgi:hypothetical protein
MFRMLMVAILLAFASLCPARATEVSLGSQAVSQELTDLWTGFCLKHFPADTAINAFAASQRATPMTPQEIKFYLHDDPGQGWYLRTQLGLYAITQEKPPFLACAVRRMTPNGIPGIKPFVDVMKAYAESHQWKLTVVPMHTKTPDGRADISAYSNGMTDVAGKPREAFLVLLTNYHGNPPDPWRQDAAGGVGVEVRFVRELLKP